MQFNPHIKELQHGLGVPADGKRGPVTTTAILLAADEGRLVVKPKAEVAEKFQAPGYADLVKLYGKAGGPDCTAGRVVLPFAFKLAWDLDQLVKIISCHTLVAEPLTRIWDETARHYGEKQFRELGLDLYGGCFNYRPMRGSDKLSTHAWGIAQDVDLSLHCFHLQGPRVALVSTDKLGKLMYFRHELLKQSPVITSSFTGHLNSGSHAVTPRISQPI